MWLALIVLHAAAGVAAFTIGIAALSPRILNRHRWIAGAVVWMVVGLVVFMVGAIAAHWNALDTASQIVFSGLAVFGCYMIRRARRARRIVPTSIGDRGWLDYVDDIGFVLISLFDGFVIVLAIDLGAPGWFVAGGAVGSIVVGHHLVAGHKVRANAQRTLDGDVNETGRSPQRE